MMKNLVIKITNIILLLIAFSTKAYATQISDNSSEVIDIFKGVTVSGQMTAIYQASSLKLKVGDLKNSDGSNLNSQELATYDHKNADGTISATIGIEKKLGDDDFFHLDLQFAGGEGVDSRLQGGAMVNTDVMEDSQNPNQIYIAKAFYEGTMKLPSKYRVTFDIGRFGVNDFFDIGAENSNQTLQFLNQAIANNGAFDYVQDIDGRGYTYGSRIGIYNDYGGIDLGVFSSDGQTQNISDKYSLLAGLTLTPKFGDLAGTYQIYAFSNRGEYAAFDDDGNLVSKDPDPGGDNTQINTADNLDNLTKNGFGVSVTQALSDKINIFAKYGQQDDDRDVRHYLDMDQTYMVGSNFAGSLWGRANDQIGIAYEIGRLTGNHRKAHEKGYSAFFDRSGGVGVGNYDDEEVFEIYYRYSLAKNTSLSFDMQNISNFYYSKNIDDVQFYAVRFTTLF